MKVFLFSLFCSVIWTAAQADVTKIVCRGTGHKSSLAFTLDRTQDGWKMHDVLASNPIVEHNLGVEANQNPIIGPQQDAGEPGSEIYQGQFDSPSPQGVGAFALAIKPSGKATLYWDDDDGGMLDFLLICRRD